MNGAYRQNVDGTSQSSFLEGLNGSQMKSAQRKLKGCHFGAYLTGSINRSWDAIKESADFSELILGCCQSFAC